MDGIIWSWRHPLLKIQPHTDWLCFFLVFKNLPIPSTPKAIKSRWGEELWDIPPSLWPLQVFSRAQELLTAQIAAVLCLVGMWALNEQ